MSTDFVYLASASPRRRELLQQIGVSFRVLGAAVVPDNRLRVFALVSVVAPLASFMLISNSAINQDSGQILNYWGTGVTPLLYACIPFAFVLLPSAAVPKAGGRR